VKFEPQSNEALQRPTKEEEIAEVPVKDHWQETPNTWVRVHVEKRTDLFVPLVDGQPFADGPKAEDLRSSRRTEVNFDNGEHSVYKDDWRANGSKRVKRFWTGRTLLLKVAALTTGEVEVPPHVDGQEVADGSGESVSLQLGSMRDELMIAQRRDPRLAEIIAVLEKKPAGEFLAAPRRDMHRTKVRAD
jgi:hypothetical protein